jgi:uncharacterized repeat protein (TIGR01451 family)
MPIHIVHGVKDPSGDTTNPVTVKISLPTTAFTVTDVQLWTFSGSSGSTSTTGTKSSSPPAAGNLGNFSIGKLGANDKVIVVIEGYFTHAGSYSIPFVAERLGSSPATEGPPTQNSVLNINVQNITLPVDISVTKQVKDPSGAFGPTATWPFGTTVSYKITVKNLTAQQPDGSTDLYLGNLLELTDTITAPNPNGVAIDITPTYYPCTSSAGADCMAQPAPASLITWNRGPVSWPFSLFTITYPAGSKGLLPAGGGSFEIKFDLLLGTKELCYHASQTNQLDNTASVSYADGSPFNDTVAANNTSTATVTLSGGPSTPCPPISAITVKKELISPVTAPPLPAPQPWGPFTYRISITNTTTGTLSNLQIQDDLNGAGTSPFTADFVAGSSNPTCNPACSSPLPVSNKPIVGSWPILFKAQFLPLAKGNTQTVDYKVTYDAPCTEISPPPTTPTTGGTISNRAVLISGATGSDMVDVPMVALPPCDLQVTKTQNPSVTSFASYPQTLNYHVQFKNNSAKTITVGSVLDAMSIDSVTYGDVPVDYSYGGGTAGSPCTVNNVTMPSGAVLSKPLTPLTPSLVPYMLDSWKGIRVIDFSGAIFGAGGTIDCDVTATLNQPPTDDSLCQGEVTGRAPPHFVNEAFMDLLPYNSYYNPPSYPVWHKEVTTQLPYCVSISVHKTTPSTAYPGGPITFNLTVTNEGNDPLSNIVLQDNVPTWVANPATWHWSCTSGPCTGSGTGNLSVTIAPSPLTLAPHASATVTITGTAPDALGSYCNDDHAEIKPFPALTYFEGVESLKNGEACVDVKPADGTPTPTPTASPVDTGSPTPTPTPTPIASPGCAQVTGDARCLPNGGYTYTFTVKNNSGKPMSQILLTPMQGSTFTLTPQLTNLPTPLQSGQSTTVTTNISNVKPGDKVCFFVSLMSDKAPCCIVQVCPTLPQCGGVSPTPTVSSSTPPTLRQPPARQQRPPPPSRRGKRRP